MLLVNQNNVSTSLNNHIQKDPQYIKDDRFVVSYFLEKVIWNYHHPQIVCVYNNIGDIYTND